MPSAPSMSLNVLMCQTPPLYKLPEPGQPFRLEAAYPTTSWHREAISPTIQRSFSFQILGRLGTTPPPCTRQVAFKTTPAIRVAVSTSPRIWLLRQTVPRPFQSSRRTTLTSTIKSFSGTWMRHLPPSNHRSLLPRLLDRTDKSQSLPNAFGLSSSLRPVA